MYALSTVDMFGGLADAYYYDVDLQSTQSAQAKGALPKEYQPVWKMPDPWCSVNQCREDFILIAEFSELEGPKPLITIPTNVSKDFDLNEFSVRIMSVDSQTQTSDSFRIHNDTHVMMSEAGKGIHAYVHNLTLYDSKARGFVRPFCISYVTGNESKLRHCHEWLQEQFGQVAQTFRQGNLLVFVRDMTHHLSDLLYTQDRFRERKGTSHPDSGGREKSSAEEELIFESLTEEGLITALKEVKLILNTVNNLLSEHSLDDSHMPTPLNSTFSTENEFTQGLNQDPQDCEIHGKPPGLQKRGLTTVASAAVLQNPIALRDTFSDLSISAQLKRSESFSGNMRGLNVMCAECDANQIEHYQPKLVRTANKRRYDKTLRSLHELCRGNAKQGITRLRYLQKYFAKDLASLKIEERDREVINTAKGLLTFGGNVQLNFLGNAQDSQMKASKSAQSDLFSDETASFASAESFLSCDDMSVDSASHVVMRSSIEEMPLIKHSSPNSSTNTLDTSSLVTISFDGSQYTESDLHVVNQIPSHAGSLTDSLTASHDSSAADISLTNMAAGDDLGSSLGLSDGSIDAGDIIKTPLRVFSLADRANHMSSDTPGSGLLKFMSSYAFSQHVLFSLLCGRPLIIVGKLAREETVRTLYNTLSFFLINSSTEQQHILHRTEVTAADLPRKLIGLIRTSKEPKDKLISPDIEQKCSVLDLDRKVYYGPCYLGGVLTEVYSRRKVHTMDSTYLAYIHVILQDLAMKAYVFYHTFIQNVASKVPRMYAQPEDARVAYRKAEQHFLGRIKVSAHDTEIIKHIAEVLHKQMDGESLEFTGLSTSSMEAIPCQVFKA